MNLEQARIEFQAASSEFAAELAKSGHRDDDAFKEESGQATLWSRLRSLGTTVLEMVAPTAVALTMKAALQAVVGSHRVIKKLADATSDAGELHRYAVAMRGLTAEYTALAERVLDQSAAKYQPLTQGFRAAAGELKASYKRATQLASNLDLAADVLNAFSRLVSAL